MKGISFVLALVLESAHALGGPSPISDKDRKTVGELLRKIHGFEQLDLRTTWGVRSRIEAEIGLRDRDGNPLRPIIGDPDYDGTPQSALELRISERAEFDRNIAKNFEDLEPVEKDDYYRAIWEHERIQRLLKPLYQEAIDKALAAYGVSPPRTAGIIVNGPPKDDSGIYIPSFRGLAISWHPIFRYSESISRNGATDPDGYVTISPAAFRAAGFDRERDVDHLGYVLYHESLHFADKLDPAADIKNTPAAELRHRDEEERLVGNVFFLSKEDREDNEEKRRSIVRLKADWIEWLGQGRDPWKKSDFTLFHGGGAPSEEFSIDPDPTRDMERLLALEQARAPGIDKFYDGLDGLGAEAKEAKMLASAARKSDLATREQRRAAEESERQAYQAKLQARHTAVMDYIEAASTLACSDPDSFQEQMTRGKFVDAFFQPDQFVKFSMCGSGEPDNCGDAVVKNVLCADGPVMPEAVLAWAQDYRQRHPGFWERLGKALNEFSRSRDRVLSRPAAGGNSGEKNEPDRPERQERSYGGCPEGTHTLGGICGRAADPL